MILFNQYLIERKKTRANRSSRGLSPVSINTKNLQWNKPSTKQIGRQLQNSEIFLPDFVTPRKIYLPLSFKFLDKVGVKFKRGEVYHYASADELKTLKQMEGVNILKSDKEQGIEISAFTLPKGGSLQNIQNIPREYLVKLDARILWDKSKGNLQSRRDEAGRKWVETIYLFNDYQKINNKLMEEVLELQAKYFEQVVDLNKPLTKYMTTINIKKVKDFISENLTDNEKKLKISYFSSSIIKDKKVYGKYVKDYLNLLVKFLKNNMSGLNLEGLSRTDQYAENIVDSFKIKEVMINTKYKPYQDYQVDINKNMEYVKGLGIVNVSQF